MVDGRHQHHTIVAVLLKAPHVAYIYYYTSSYKSNAQIDNSPAVRLSKLWLELCLRMNVFVLLASKKIMRNNRGYSRNAGQVAVRLGLSIPSLEHRFTAIAFGMLL